MAMAMALEIHNQSQGVKIQLPKDGHQFSGGDSRVCPRNDTLATATTLSLSSPSNNNDDHHQYLKCKLTNYTQISKSAAAVAASDYRMQKPHHIKAIGSQRKRKCLDNHIIMDSHRSASKIQQLITNRRTSPKLDLRLSLESTSRSDVSSPPSDRIILEDHRRRPQAPRAVTTTTATSMVLVGCPRCLMYVMLSENPCSSRSCPKCKSSVLLDFVHHESATTTELAVAGNTTRRKMARKSLN